MRVVLAVVAVVVVAAMPTAHALGGVQQENDQRKVAGSWTLNTWLTDPGDQIQREIATDFGPRNIYDIDAAPAQPRLVRNETGGGMDARATLKPRPLLNADDNKHIQSLVELASLPPAALTITQSADTVTIVDPANRSRTFATNGRREKQAFDSGEIDARTRWDGPQLLTEYDARHGVVLQFSYMVVADNHLLVRISVRSPEGDTLPYVIRHVYDRVERN